METVTVLAEKGLASTEEANEEAGDENRRKLLVRYTKYCLKLTAVRAAIPPVWIAQEQLPQAEHPTMHVECLG